MVGKCRIFKENLRFHLDMRKISVYNNGACIGYVPFFVRIKADKQQPTVNITGGEKNANI